MFFQQHSKLFLVFLDLPVAIVRLLKNPVYVCLACGLSFDIFTMGFYTFFPKYIQTYFGLTPSIASIVAGTVRCSHLSDFTNGLSVCKIFSYFFLSRRYWRIGLGHRTNSQRKNYEPSESHCTAKHGSSCFDYFNLQCGFLDYDEHKLLRTEVRRSQVSL